ncbi:MAG TPA: acetyl-CoA carboxylase biotin carboxyl carrier protein [Vicinamibacteria bacterium]
MDLDFIERLIRVLDESGLDHVEIERGGTRVRISRSPPSRFVEEAAAPAPQAPPPPPASTAAVQPAVGGAAVGGKSAGAGPGTNLHDVTSPMVGTFYRASSPGTPPFVEVGARISKGDVLCIIEAMKLMNELEAEVEGEVREVCANDGEPVEFGQVLFRVKLG